MATAAELAGTNPPTPNDSISFVPTLIGKGTQKSHEFLYWEFHEGGFKQAALYQSRWKGIRSGGPNEPIVLYDVTNDIGEKTNVAKAQPAIAETISTYLKSARTASPEWEPKWQPGSR